MLIASWAALVVGTVAVVVAVFQGGLLLLYVAIGASAVAMTLAVGYLLRGSGGRSRSEEAPDRTS